MTGAALVEVGRVIKPHGLHGEVVVRVLSDVDGRIAPGVEVRVGGVASTVATVRDHQGRPLVRFSHVSDRSAAEMLRGAVVEAEPVDVGELDTYLASELVGIQVLDRSGDILGTVSALVEMPAVAGYDLLEVTTGGRTWLLPAADELVEVIDDAEGLRLVVGDLPEGLMSVAPNEGGA